MHRSKDKISARWETLMTGLCKGVKAYIRSQNASYPAYNQPVEASPGTQSPDPRTSLSLASEGSMAMTKM
ncbi:unnamed protein product [Protopolystoma xenopodis]|uniref:Uncharacterized protein n=1 Tax=Protopolystoma xenopodis TaxID=117903 RepID=A0A3S5BGE6_9PLAT|nr:unnamed protein product [Protopolystoma xenopodis]